MKLGDQIRRFSDDELVEFLLNFDMDAIEHEWCINLCPLRLKGCPVDDNNVCTYIKSESVLKEYLKIEVK